jgi:hypothetical protein
MGVLTVGILLLIGFVCLMMLLKARQLQQRQKQPSCDATGHGLQFHAYDGSGKLLHHCRCGHRIEYGMEPSWCRVCAEPDLERRVRQSMNT